MLQGQDQNKRPRFGFLYLIENTISRSGNIEGEVVLISKLAQLQKKVALPDSLLAYGALATRIIALHCTAFKVAFGALLGSSSSCVRVRLPNK